MEYRYIKGYKNPYRISDQGVLEKKLSNGKWKIIKPSLVSNILRVKLVRPDGSRHHVTVRALMRDYFMGGERKGMCVTCRNNMQTDCALENLIFVPRYCAATSGAGENRKPVAKVDKYGAVLEVYRSIREAAKKNYMSESSVSERCHNKIKDPFKRCYYSFKFEV